MNGNIKQTLLAPAALLLAVTLGLAGCTQGEDALPGADGNDGARILNINVGPKQGFTSGNADSNAGAPATRSTVNEDTGAMSWEEGDRIFLHVTYTGASAKGYTMVRNAASAWNFYKGYVGTHDKDGNAIDLSALTSFSGIPVPMGATAITQIIAKHIDNDTFFSTSGNGSTAKCIFGSGSCDQLTQTINNPVMDANITLNLTRRSFARLHFPGGLTPGKKYYADGFYSVVELELDQSSGFITTNAAYFTAADDGSLSLCFKADDYPSYTITLKEKDDDADDTNDKVVYTATFNVSTGSSYQCIIPAAGGIDPDSKPDLLIPAPIVAGNTVYVVNGYYVTAPDADESKVYQWAASEAATVMDSDPCAGNGDWRMPTMKDFEKMGGFSTPWSQDVGGDLLSVTSDVDAWNAAFPTNNYWSSVLKTSPDTYVWYIFSSTSANYYSDNKTNSFRVRCVQVK